MARSDFSRAFKKSFKVHAAINAEMKGDPGTVDPAKVVRAMRGRDFDLSQSDAELTEVIEKAAADAGVTLKPPGRKFT